MATLAIRALLPVGLAEGDHLRRWLLLIVHLSTGTLAYIGGYLLTRVGRADLTEIWGKLLRRS